MAVPAPDTLVSLRTELHTLAARRGWSAVTALTSDDAHNRPVLLVGTAGLDLAPLRGWLSTSVRDSTGDEVPVDVREASDSTAEALLAARRVVLAVDAGTPLPADAADLVRRLPGGHDDLCVVVVVGPDDTPDDLRATAAGVAVVLAAATDTLPDPDGDSVLAWAAGDPPAALADRLGRDARTLADRIAAPGGAEARWLDHALEIAAEAATAPDIAGTFDRAVAAVDTVRRLRGELVTALDHEIRLLRGTGPGSVAAWRARATREVDRPGTASTQAVAAPLLETWRRGEGCDLDTRLARVRVRVAAALDGVEEAPAELTRAVRAAVPRWPDFAPVPPHPDAAGTSPPAPGPGVSPTTQRLLVVAGAVVGAVAAPPGPLSVATAAAGAATGMAAGRMLTRLSDKEHDQHSARLRQTAAASVDDTVRTFGTDLVDALTGTRDSVAAAFDTALAGLTGTLHTSGTATDTPGAGVAADTAAIDVIRRRLLALSVADG